MNNRINCSGLIDLRTQPHDESEPDLREWTDVSLDSTLALHADKVRPSNSNSEG